MANVALSEAEKTFILHGVEVCSIFFPDMTTNQQYISTFRKIFVAMVVPAEIIAQWSWNVKWLITPVDRLDCGWQTQIF